MEVTNSFAVPHQEVGNDNVAVGKEFNSQMFALLQLVNPMEKIVGWYATAYDGRLVDSSSLIHDFFTQVRYILGWYYDMNNTLLLKT